MILKRGAVVGVRDDLDFLSKARPALVVQASDYIEARDTILVCLFTTTLAEGVFFRPIIEPSEDNGLTARSALQADKLMAVRKSRLSEEVWGYLSSTDMKKINRAIRLILEM